MFRPKAIPSIDVVGIELTLDENIIDFEAFNKEFVDQFQKRLKRIAYEGREFWKTQAGMKLHSTKEAYQNSLGVKDNGDGTYTVALAGVGGKGTKQQRWLAVALEQGIPRYDMKPGLLAGEPVRRIRLADGKFRMVHPAQKEKWFHPGFQGLHLQDIVADHINNVLVPEATEAAFNAAMKKLHPKKGKKK